MNRYIVKKIEEDFECFVAEISAKDIYEAARLAKTMTDEDKDANYSIVPKWDKKEDDDFILIGRRKNELAYLKYLCWSLMDIDVINKKHYELITQVLKTDLSEGD